MTNPQAGVIYLVADVISGVCFCDEDDADGKDTLCDMDFYDALASSQDEIYGKVSGDIAALIEAEYGISMR